MQWKKATIEDVQTLVQLRKVQLCDEGQTPTDIDEELTRYFTEQLQSAHFVQYVVEDDGTAIASGGIQFLQLPPSYVNKGGMRGYIMNIYTARDYRGQGIAKKMLDTLVSEAQARNVTRLLLYASHMGKPIYEKYGFIAQDAWMEYTIDTE